MSKTVFLFPGQGSQKVGMGAHLVESHPDVIGRYFSLAEEASGLPIRTLCLEGPIEDLTKTEVAQPALFALSMAVLEVAREQGVTADFVAGHSLGEYTAAAAAGCLSAEDGMRLVAERGRRMAEIQSERPGTMGAVLGLDAERVAELCDEASEAGLVAPANMNTTTQTVVSGEEAAVERLIELATGAGAKRALRLQVGAAFHSALMEPVQSALGATMETLEWSDPSPPMVSNASAQIVTDADGIRAALVAQIASPVLWVDCVRTLVGAGATTFLELGPGRVLSGLVRQIDADAETFAADSPAQLAKFVERAGAA